MGTLFEALRPLIRFVVRRPLAVLATALLLAALGLASASRLSIDTDLANLIPPDYPSVQALERLRATVGAEQPLDVGILSPDFAASRAFAEDLIPRALELRGADGERLFKGYEFYRDPSFLNANALYLATDDELDQLEDLLEDAAEEARLAANPFFFDLEDDLGLDDEDPAAGDELERSLASLQMGEYFVSPDSTVLAVRFVPGGSQTNLAFVRKTYARMDSLVAAMAPAGYHPEMEVINAGRLLRQMLEIEAITDDVVNSFGAGATMVLLLVILYFLYKSLQVRGVTRRTLFSELARLPVTAFLLGVPLLMSLAWTFGVASLVFGTLNLMTSTLALVLFGLGIDYGIHNYARYAEERARNHSPEEAAEVAFISTGQAIAVSAFTTAAALFVLTMADFRGFSEFGLIGGLGILFALLAMLLVLPALLVLFERVGILRLTSGRQRGPFTVSRRPFPAARPLVIASLVAVAAAIVVLPQERFEYDFGALEPHLASFHDRQSRISPAFTDGGRRNPAYILVDSNEHAQEVSAELRRRAETDTLILAVESIQDRFPMTPAAAEDRLARLADIRDLADDPFLAGDTTGQIDRVRRAASTTEPIPLAEVPESLRQPFTDRQGQIGGFVFVYPSRSLSDARVSMAFAESVGEVTTSDGTTYHAGSTSIIAADMLRLLMAESPLMLGLTLVLIIALMLLAFGSVRWMLLALLPLIVGVLWMLGLMVLFDVPLTFYNLVVLPAVLGIGNDCGVHLVHRYREEGPGSLRLILRSTGEHVSMGAITTTISFAGLLLSFHPGLRSIGMLAIIGIGATLLAALVFLPAMLQWLEDRDVRRAEQRSTAAVAR